MIDVYGLAAAHFMNGAARTYDRPASKRPWPVWIKLRRAAGRLSWKMILTGLDPGSGAGLKADTTAARAAGRK